MYNKLPLVSLIIPSFNRPDTLGIAIESALAQDYSNLEIIISDDCSTIETIKIIEKYLLDKRIIFSINEKNLGLYGNFKIAIEQKAQGEFFSMVNNDDELINPHFISECVNLINRDTEIQIIKGASIHHNGISGKVHNYEKYNEIENGISFFEKYNYEYEFGFDGIFVARELFNQFNFFQFNFIGLDFFINFIMAMQGKVAFVKTPSYQFNVHDANSSSKAYTTQQMAFFFNEIDQVMAYYQKKAQPNDSVFMEIKNKHHYQYIASCIEYYYITKRGSLSDVVSFLKQRNSNEVSKYLKSKRWLKCKIVFLSPSIGKQIVKLKWKLGEKE